MRKEKILVAGAMGRIEKGEEFLKRVREMEQKLGISIQVFTASKIFGKLHLLVAAQLAVRAEGEKRMIANSLSGEILLYASGERQLQKAVQKIGIRNGETEIGIVVVGHCDLGKVLRVLALKRNDEVLKADGKDLTSFGISEIEISTVPEEKRTELVLERIALTPLEK